MHMYPTSKSYASNLSHVLQNLLIHRLEWRVAQVFVILCASALNPLQIYARPLLFLTSAAGREGKIDHVSFVIRDA